MKAGIPQTNNQIKSVDTILSNIDDFAWYLNNDSEFEYISPSVVSSLGYSNHELNFTTFRALLFPESQKVLDSEIRFMKNNNGEVGKRTWVIGAKNKHNITVWLETNSNLIYDNQNRPLAMVGTCRDITQRYTELCRLYESEANLQSQINTTSDNIWSINSNYELLVFNQSFFYHFKLAFDVDLLIGQNILEQLPKVLRQEWQNRYNRALKGEKFRITDHFEYEGVPQYVEISFNPIFLQNEVIGVSVFSRDTSEKVNYAKKLEKNEREFKWLNGLMLKLMTLDTTNGLFNLISSSLSDQYPNTLIVISQFDKTEQKTTLVSISGINEKLMSKAIELIGFNPFLNPFRFTEIDLSDLKKGALKKHPNGIADLASGILNPSQIDALSAILPTYDAYSLGIVKDKSLYAAIHLITLSPNVMFDKGLLESVANISSIVVQQKHLYQALTDSENQFKQLVRNVPGVTYRCKYDANWTMEFISDEIETLTGYPASDFIQNNKRTFASVIHPKFTEYVEKSVVKPLKNKQTFTLEYCLVTKMGQIKWVSEKGRAVYNKKGEIEWIDGIITDNTRAKEAEKRLTENEEKFRSIFENSNTAISIVNQNRVLMVNKAWEVLLGYSNAEALALNPSDVIHYDERETRAKMLHDRLKGIDHPNNYVLHMIDKLGHDKWVDVSVSKINYEGQIALLVLGIDITERKKAEMELNKFATGIMNSPSSIVITDIDGNIEYANPFFTESTGYELNEVIGQNPRILQSGLTPKDVFYDLWATILRGNVWNGEFINKKKNGDLYWESARIAPIKNSEDIITNFIAIKEDVTDIKQYQEKLELTARELKENNAQKDRFFSIIAHDLRSPFSGLVGITDLLYRNYHHFEPEKIESYLKHAAETSQHLFKLLENLLEWAKTQTGRHEYKPEPTNISAMVNDAFELIKIAATEKNITLLNHTNAEIKAFVDPNMLFTIFRNLVSNALKYSYPNGHIIIDAQMEPDFVKISVTDNGVGIPEKVQNKLFKLEETYSTPGTNNEKGTGLGLILCKEFVKKMGGKIWCESTEGKGSSFFFTVPFKA